MRSSLWCFSYLREFSQVGIEASAVDEKLRLGLFPKHSNGWNGKQDTRAELSSIHRDGHRGKRVGTAARPRVKVNVPFLAFGV